MTWKITVLALLLSSVAFGASAADQLSAARVEIQSNNTTHVYRVANHRVARRVSDPMLHRAGWSCRALYRGYVAIVTCQQGQRELTNVNVCARGHRNRFAIPGSRIQITTSCGDSITTNDVPWDR